MLHHFFPPPIHILSLLFFTIFPLNIDFLSFEVYTCIACGYLWLSEGWLLREELFLGEAEFEMDGVGIFGEMEMGDGIPHFFEVEGRFLWDGF